MLNCPASNNTCPARALKRTSLLDRLSTQKYRDMDGMPIDQDVYREALEALRSVLLNGCPQCVRNAVIWLGNDMKWPYHRGLQLILLEALLDRVEPRVH